MGFFPLWHRPHQCRFLHSGKKKKKITGREYAKISLVFMEEEETEDSICFRFFTFDLGFSVVLIPCILYNAFH